MEKLSGGVKLANLGAILLGALYAAGFLVVTFHLSRFGVTPADWVRPQYLVAGVWCLTPLLLFVGAAAFAVIQYIEPWIRRSWVAPKRTRTYRHIVGAIQGASALVATFVIIAYEVGRLMQKSTASSGSPAPLVVTSTLALLSLLAAGAAFCAVELVSAVARRKDPAPLRLDRAAAALSLGSIAALAAVAFSIVYIWYFSVHVYPAIPSSLGGGRPQIVVFILEPGGNTSPVTPDRLGTRSVPYRLLLRTDNSYVVESTVKGERAIEFRQNAVGGMVVLRRQGSR